MDQNLYPANYGLFWRRAIGSEVTSEILPFILGAITFDRISKRAETVAACLGRFILGIAGEIKEQQQEHIGEFHNAA